MALRAMVKALVKAMVKGLGLESLLLALRAWSWPWL